eukprot:m.218082 g.218082  ORF g.218082 m.218082 type:complete len:669 (+) comp33252_c0_seq1:205-2211(+)
MTSVHRHSVAGLLCVVGIVFVLAVNFAPDMLMPMTSNAQSAKLSVSHLQAEIVAHKAQLDKQYQEFTKEIAALKAHRTEQQAATQTGNDPTNLQKPTGARQRKSVMVFDDVGGGSRRPAAASLPTLKNAVVVDDTGAANHNNGSPIHLNPTSRVSVGVEGGDHDLTSQTVVPIVDINSVPSTPIERGCERQALLHGHSLKELREMYLSGGSMKWFLVDSFVMHTGTPCGSHLRNHPNCSFLPAVVVVLSPLVYKEAPYHAMTKNNANRMRQKDYDLAMDKQVTWTCEYSGGDLPQSKTLRYEAMPTIKDGRKHSAIIRCPAPPEIFGGTADLSGRLRTNLAIKASSPLNNINFNLNKNKMIKKNNRNNNDDDGSTDPNLLMHYTGIHPCDRELVPSDMYLGVCTAFAEPKVLGLKSIAMWTRFMLDSGAGFVALYLDPSGDADAFEAQAHAVLEQEIKDGNVVTVMFRMDNRRPFQTQQAQENHCQWRFRGKAKWLAQLDVDEFFQPLGDFLTLKSVLEKYDNNDNVGAIQVRHRFWDHHPVLQKNFSNLRYDVWNMIWRDNRTTSVGREKTISKPELVDYIDVHTIGTGRGVKVPSSETQLRMNHFKRQHSGYDDGYNCSPMEHVSHEPVASSCFNASHPGNIVADVTFQEYYHRIKGDSKKSSVVE